MDNIYREISNPDLLKESSEESKVVMGVESLIRGDHQEALDYFESALSQTHEVPAAWLGKAHAEAWLLETGRDAFENIHRSLQHAYTLTNEDEDLLKRHYAGILVVLLNRYANLMEYHRGKGAEAEKRKEKAEEKAQISTALAAAGAAVGVTSEKTSWKIGGYGAALAGGASAANYLSEAKEAKSVQKGRDALATTEMLLSVSIAEEAQQINVQDPSMRKKMSEAISSWKKVSASLCQRQLNKIKGRIKSEGLDSPLKRGAFDDEWNNREGIVNLIGRADFVLRRVPIQGKENILESIREAKSTIRNIREEGLYKSNEPKKFLKRIIYWSPLWAMVVCAFVVSGYESISIEMFDYVLISSLTLCAVSLLFGETEFQKRFREMNKKLHESIDNSGSIRKEDISLIGEEVEYGYENKKNVLS